jgi:biopolymer transport protein ExbD
MKRRLAGDIRGSFSMSAGWLFADLLLVLAMLFLAANTMGIHPPPKPTPTPTVTPTQAPLAQLEQKYHEFPIYVDRQAFLNNDPAAVRSVTQQIVSQTFLRGRSAGLIVAYGTDTSDCDVAYQAAQKVYNLVRHIGQSNLTFKKTVDYTTLCRLHSDINTIIVDIFLFTEHTSLAHNQHISA